MSIELDDELHAFPRPGCRIHVMQDAPAGIGVFFAVSDAFCLERCALFYGVGVSLGF